MCCRSVEDISTLAMGSRKRVGELRGCMSLILATLVGPEIKNCDANEIFLHQDFLLHLLTSLHPHTYQRLHSFHLHHPSSLCIACARSLRAGASSGRDLSCHFTKYEVRPAQVEPGRWCCRKCPPTAHTKFSHRRL